MCMRPAWWRFLTSYLFPLSTAFLLWSFPKTSVTKALQQYHNHHSPSSEGKRLVLNAIPVSSSSSSSRSSSYNHRCWIGRNRIDSIVGIHCGYGFIQYQHHSDRSTTIDLLSTPTSNEPPPTSTWLTIAFNLTASPPSISPTILSSYGQGSVRLSPP